MEYADFKELLIIEQNVFIHNHTLPCIWQNTRKPGIASFLNEVWFADKNVSVVWVIMAWEEGGSAGEQVFKYGTGESGGTAYSAAVVAAGNR